LRVPFVTKSLHYKIFLNLLPYLVVRHRLTGTANKKSNNRKKNKEEGIKHVRILGWAIEVKIIQGVS
jgi:hypothetical protein